MEIVNREELAERESWKIEDEQFGLNIFEETPFWWDQEDMFEEYGNGEYGMTGDGWLSFHEAAFNEGLKMKEVQRIYIEFMRISCRGLVKITLESFNIFVNEGYAVQEILDIWEDEENKVKEIISCKC